MTLYLKHVGLLYALVLLTFYGAIHISCNSKKDSKKKIVYINSYHRGHPSSDEIMDAVIGYFPADSFQVSSYLMDTKRNPSIDYIRNIAAKLYDSIKRINPDVLIVSDDNAVKYIVKPNIERLSMPVVFCGVNGSDLEYQLPANKVTGMLEILPVSETISALRTYYPEMKKLLILTENTTTSRKEKDLLDPTFKEAGVSATHELVDDFETWKSKFREANSLYDIIYIVTHGAIKNWDHDEAVQFVDQHIQIPVITCEDFMMPYAVFGMTKVASEQGLWAATTAKELVNGSAPSDFPVTKNQLSTTWLNLNLAKKIDFGPDTTIFNNLKIVRD